MEQRINSYEKGAGALKALYGLGIYLAKSPLEKSLLNLIYFGETEQRLYVLDAWREAPFYTERERAALAWAEAVTKITNGNVPDEIYAAARQQFSEAELIDLTLAVITINSYNRINIAFGAPVGTYQPGQYAVHVN